MQKEIGVVHNVSVHDITMLSHCAGCRVIRDPFRVFSTVDSNSKKFNLEENLFGTVGGFEVAEGSTRFMLVRNRQDTTVGPRTIILRGGSGRFFYLMPCNILVLIYNIIFK